MPYVKKKNTESLAEMLSEASTNRISIKKIIE